jgi:hypothetical protein
MPLLAELELIRKYRLGARRDVLILDDARLFFDGPFSAGVLPDAYKPLVPKYMAGVDWIKEMWGETHLLKIDRRDEGYLMLIPIGV